METFLWISEQTLLLSLSDIFVAPGTKEINFPMLWKYELTLCQRKLDSSITIKSDFLRRLRPSEQIFHRNDRLGALRIVPTVIALIFRDVLQGGLLYNQNSSVPMTTGTNSNNLYMNHYIFESGEAGWVGGGSFMFSCVCGRINEM